MFILEVQEMIVQKTKNTAEEVEGGRLLVLFWGLKYNHFLGVQNKIYPYRVDLLEHIFLRSNYVFKNHF